MAALKRRKGTVWIPPYGACFPMLVAGMKADVVCLQTLAGFRKIFGLTSVSQETMREAFWDNREYCEALASLLYEADSGQPMTVTIVSAKEPSRSESRD